jgi:CheY-like chemotaxis protein
MPTLPTPLLVAGLDARSLLLEAPVLQRDQDLIIQEEWGRDLLPRIAQTRARLVVLGPRLPDLELTEAVRRIRSSPVTRGISVLVLVPAADPPGVEAAAIAAGANAALRRPLDRGVLESWIAKLLAVPRRIETRIPVQGQVVGTPRPAALHFCGLTRNVSLNGMLLASPVKLGPSPDLDLEFSVSGIAHRLRAIGRVVREAPEVGWPYLGYGIEFLFMPPESQEVVGALVGRRLPLFPSKRELSLGIHSTVRREEWVYEILEPVPRDTGWQAEIRRATRAGWRPGIAGPFFVVEAGSPEGALRAARDFLVRYG